MNIEKRVAELESEVAALKIVLSALLAEKARPDLLRVYAPILQRTNLQIADGTLDGDSGKITEKAQRLMLNARLR